MIVSPDGSIYNHESHTVSAVEFKCPVSGIHTEVPQRYYLQCQATMDALDVENMYYVSWKPDISTVHEVFRDTDTYQMALDIVCDTYCRNQSRRPKKLPEHLPLLKEHINNGRKRSRFIGEFSSMTAVSKQVSMQSNKQLVAKAMDIKDRLIQTVTDGYQLRREKGTEAVVFLCSDLDRSFDKFALRWAPINWFPKGYSLNTEVMRKIK